MVLPASGAASGECLHNWEYGEGGRTCPGCGTFESAEIETQVAIRHEVFNVPRPASFTVPEVAVSPDDWPIEHLMRGRVLMERWAHEQGILDADQMLVIEVRGRKRRDDDLPFGVRPRDAAIVVHHDEDGWT